MKRFKKAAINSAKILISVILLYLVFRKMPFKEIAGLWKNINFSYLISAAALFFLSQIFSARRLQYFFENSGFPISYRSNLKLYFLGMFYNFFIPGGIGGDAYKVYLLNRNFGWAAKPLTSAIFCDRLVGLIAILLIICGLGFVIFPKFGIYLSLIFLAGLSAAYFIFVKFFPKFRKIFLKALLISAAVQILQVFSFILLLKSIGTSGHFAGYAVLFLASSVLSLLSFAGIGIREMLFLQASKYLDFNAEASVSASLLFTAITAFFSLIGFTFQIGKLDLKLSQKS